MATALGSTALLAQSVPEINYDANANILNLPSFGEVAGVATNSKGQVFVYARTGHGVATLGDERTFYHGGSRLFQFDQTGKFVKEIGQGVYAVNFAQQVRVDPQDNIWIVDAGSNMIVKFDPDGKRPWCSDVSPRASTSGRVRACRPARQTSLRRVAPLRRVAAVVVVKAVAVATRPRAPASAATASTVRPT